MKQLVGENGSEGSTHYFVVVPAAKSSVRVDLGALFALLRRRWLPILAGGLLGAAVCAVHAYFIADEIFRSSAVIAVESGEAASPAPRGLSGVASLAGISLNSEGSKRDEYIALLSSRRLLESFIRQKNLLPILYADRYEAAGNTWRKPPPSLSMAATSFLLRNFRVREDKTTGLLNAQLDWKDRALAAQWLTQLIGAANQIVRESAESEASRNLDYLRAQSARETVDTVRQSITQLINENMNRAMMAHVRPDFPFQFIDPPGVPDTRISPMRMVEVLLGFFVGLLGASLLFLWLWRSQVFVSASAPSHI